MARRPQMAAEDRPGTKRIGALRALAPFLRPYPGMVLGALLALTVTASVSLVLPIAVRRVVDGFEQGRRASGPVLPCRAGHRRAARAWDRGAVVIL